jgi:hypothetical protein
MIDDSTSGRANLEAVAIFARARLTLEPAAYEAAQREAAWALASAVIEAAVAVGFQVAREDIPTILISGSRYERARVSVDPGQSEATVELFRKNGDSQTFSAHLEFDPVERRFVASGKGDAVAAVARLFANALLSQR